MAAALVGALLSGLLPVAVRAQSAVGSDPIEAAQPRTQSERLARPGAAVERSQVDERSMRELIGKLVACGTRSSLSSWSDASRGIGCGRDRVLTRLNEIARNSGGRLQVIIDRFESTSPRTSDKPVTLQNIYALLPGTDDPFAPVVSHRLD